MSAPINHNPVVSSFGSSSKKPTPSLRFLRQADPMWATVKLGASKVSIGKSGCLRTLYAEALRTLDVDNAATPITVNKKAIAAGAYIGAGIVQATLARALGLVVSQAVHSDAAIRAGLIAERSEPTLWVIHVDHGGSAAADHFVLGFGVYLHDGQTKIACADPATGGVCYLDIDTLSGPAHWGNKTYRIRSVRKLTKSQASL